MEFVNICDLLINCVYFCHLTVFGNHTLLAEIAENKLQLELKTIWIGLQFECEFWIYQTDLSHWLFSNDKMLEVVGSPYHKKTIRRNASKFVMHFNWFRKEWNGGHQNKEKYQIKPNRTQRECIWFSARKENTMTESRLGLILIRRELLYVRHGKRAFKRVAQYHYANVTHALNHGKLISS